MGMQVTPSASVVSGNQTITGQLGVTQSAFAASWHTNVDEAIVAAENTGGALNLLVANATDATPGANRVKVYVRPGSVSGLSLRVRAGAAGAETILLDNIPV